MKEHPILFCTEMVKAILDGRKTQTRRVMTPQPPMNYEYKGNDGGNPYLPNEGRDYWMDGYAIWRPKLKYQVGDRLWVKETFTYITKAENEFYTHRRPDGCPVEIIYKADGFYDVYWKPSIFMPRKYSRITLEITDIRAERLQDITLSDILAEGLYTLGQGQKYYSELWDSINAKRGHGWDKNEWVWVITF